ncbi:MAG TPA: ABC transporter substrate-binding protein [Pyrinomonadaceae bacterium]|nr:ABC transporter substrate-binding protein [Pyrinomonadaceae bacterium]
MSTAQENLEARLRRGRQIYVSGASASGKAILAYIGEQSLELPASSMPCANCHGLDGRGKPEGGIDPSNITPEFLTKPYASTQAYQRKHEPYTDRGIELAITRGLDPSGNKLLTVMPRYVMTREDLSDLIVYMSRLGKDRDPGITDDKLVIATVLPARGALAEMGSAVRAVLTAYFEEVNNAGGIYNRRVELRFAETADTPAATRKSIESLLSSEQVFAFTCAFIAGAEKEVLPLFSEKQVPLVGPITLFPQTTLPLNRHVFYQLSGVVGQERVLTKFAATKSEIKNTGIAIVSQENENNALLIEAIRTQITKSGLVEPQTISYVPGTFDAAQTVRQLRQTNRAAVFFLGPSQDSLSFMQSAAESSWFPYVFLSEVDAEIFSAPAGFDERIFMAFPTSPADQTADGMKEFRSLAAKHQLPTKHVAAQISAYGAAKVLVEGLKRTGKDLSREKLVQSLEGLFEFRTGLTPAVTFGPNRRIGAIGAYVITVNLKDKQFLPISGWIDID